MPNDVKIDDLRGGSSVAQAILNEGSGGIEALRNTTTLRKDEWKDMDTRVVKAAQNRLVGVGDLLSRGLTYNLTNALGTTVLEYEQESDMNDASVSMTAKEKGDNDALTYDIAYLPIPIVHKMFEINARKLAASRRMGQPLDTRQAEIASKKVAEKIEDILFTGDENLAFGGGTIYGYMDHPNRQTGSLSADWDADSSGVTGQAILTDVLNMRQALLDVKKYGPYILYIPANYETKIDDDYTTNYPITIRERLMKLNSIMDIKVSDHITDDNVLLVEMDSETVRMVTGWEPTAVEWKSGDTMSLYYKIMAIMVPQIIVNSDGYTGIAHYN